MAGKEEEEDGEEGRERGGRRVDDLSEGMRRSGQCSGPELKVLAQAHLTGATHTSARGKHH